MSSSTEVDPTPNWKKLRQNGECDVLSVLDLANERVHLKTQLQQKFYHQLMAQVYLGRGSDDLFFLQNLLTDRRFLLKQCTGTHDTLKAVATEAYDKTLMTMKMLHARRPLYTYRWTKYRTADLAASHMKKLLFYVQAKNRQQAFAFLSRILMLHKAKKIHEMALLVEKVLSGFFMTLTVKTFPRKFEFIVEMCNLMGMTFVGDLRLDGQLFELAPQEQLVKLFAVPFQDDRDDDKPYVFGDRTTFNDPLKVDSSFLKYK